MKTHCLLVFALIFFSLQVKSQKRSDQLESLKIELRENDSIKGVIEKKMEECKKEASKNEATIANLKIELTLLRQSKDSILKIQSIFVNRPYVSIFNQNWAKSYLSAMDAEALIGTISEAKSIDDWELAFKKNLPAYCYHEFDSAKQHGVLLNIPAIRLLNDTLEKLSFLWRLPDSKDIELLNNNLKKYKKQLTEIITSQSTSFPKWAKSGTDVFGWNLVPLAYRRTASTQWFGKTFASFFFKNDTDPKIKKSFSLFEIYEDTPNEITLSDVDEITNYGIYIRLIKNN
jgi:uncharacterized protein (TIGR02145 family)